MTAYLGDFPEDQSVYIPFNTFDSNDPAASVTATTVIDSDIYVHKDGSATSIVTDGATINIEITAGGIGSHMITIDTSVHADYATGSDYAVRVEGMTVDGGLINAWVGSFSIENRFMRGTDSAALASSRFSLTRSRRSTRTFGHASIGACERRHFSVTDTVQSLFEQIYLLTPYPLGLLPSQEALQPRIR